MRSKIARLATTLPLTVQPKTFAGPVRVDISSWDIRPRTWA